MSLFREARLMEALLEVLADSSCASKVKFIATHATEAPSLSYQVRSTVNNSHLNHPFLEAEEVIRIVAITEPLRIH